MPGADLGGECRGCALPPPPPRDDLRLSNATGVYVWSPSVTLFLSGAPPPKKIVDPPLYTVKSNFYR